MGSKVKKAGADARDPGARGWRRRTGPDEFGRDSRLRAAAPLPPGGPGAGRARPDSRARRGTTPKTSPGTPQKRAATEEASQPAPSRGRPWGEVGAADAGPSRVKKTSRRSSQSFNRSRPDSRGPAWSSSVPKSRPVSLGFSGHHLAEKSALTPTHQTSIISIRPGRRGAGLQLPECDSTPPSASTSGSRAQHSGR